MDAVAQPTPASRLAEADAVEVPEHARVDERPRHPRLVARPLDDLESRLRDPQRRSPEAVLTRRQEPEASVEPRRALEEDERLRAIVQLRQREADERRTDAPRLHARR